MEDFRPVTSVERVLYAIYLEQKKTNEILEKLIQKEVVKEDAPVRGTRNKKGENS